MNLGREQIPLEVTIPKLCIYVFRLYSCVSNQSNQSIYKIGVMYIYTDWFIYPLSNNFDQWHYTYTLTDIQKPLCPTLYTYVHTYTVILVYMEIKSLFLTFFQVLVQY